MNPRDCKRILDNFDTVSYSRMGQFFFDFDFFLGVLCVFLVTSWGNIKLYVLAICTTWVHIAFEKPFFVLPK